MIKHRFMLGMALVGVTALLPLTALAQKGAPVEPLVGLDSSVRQAMGLPAVAPPDAKAFAGVVRLSATEAAAFDTYDRMKLAANDSVGRLLSHRSVVSYSYSRDILTPAISVYVGEEGEDHSLSDLLQEWRALGFQVNTHHVPFSKSVYVGVRNALSNELWGIATNVDIDPRTKVHYDLDQSALDAGKLAVEYVRGLKATGVVIFDGYLPGNEPRIELAMDESGVETARSSLPKEFVGLIEPTRGSRAQLAQAAGPWAGSGTTWSGRLLTEGVVRGGKRFNTGLSCSSGPVVRDQYDRDFVLTAGHCYNGTTSGNVSGAQVSIYASCNVSSDPSCTPYTYGGVDSSVWTINPGYAATGWFVHQGWPGWGPLQTTAYTDQTVGSWDLNNGDDLVCIEGASPNKYGGPAQVSAASACGIAIGWTLGGFYYIHMYPYQPVCTGDSGAYVRKPTGGSNGSWNAGTFRAIDSENPAVTSIGDGCHMRDGSSPNIRALLTTFYKTHLWLHYLSYGYNSVWAKTW